MSWICSYTCTIDYEKGKKVIKKSNQEYSVQR